MDPDDVAPALRSSEVFSVAVTAYANLRGYLADRYGDTEPDIAGWLRERNVAWVDGVDEADELTELWVASRERGRLPIAAEPHPRS